MTLQQESYQAQIDNLQLQLIHLTKQFEALRKYKVDRHISYNCYLETHNSCKGRSCRCKCHNKTLEEC